MELSCQSGKTNQPDGRIKIDEQIDVAGVVVLSPRDAAEDPNIAGPALFTGGDHSATVTAKPPSEGGFGKPERTVDGRIQFHAKVIAGGFDELSERMKPRFTVIRFIGTDHRLGYAGTPRQFGL